MGDSEKHNNNKDMDVESAVAESGENPAVIINAGSLSDPRVLEALRAKMASSMVPTEIPPYLKRKVKALKKIQMEHINLEVEFFKELHNLEIQYEKNFLPLYEKRSHIVTGALVPTDEDCDFPSDSEDDDEELKDGVEKVTLDEKPKEVKDEEKITDVKGIPEFWLTALKNAPIIAESIEEHDEPILKHLLDLKVKTCIEPMGFDLEFHFEPNDYFSNSVLTKHYDMQCSPDKSDPFTFDGPEIVKCRGCAIDWKKGKNVTVRTVKKKQKHKSRGSTRVVTKSIQNDSFFNFFSPPATPDDMNDEVDDETRNTITTDFEAGNLIKDRIIPQAVLYFTGENLVDDEFDEDEEDEEDEEADEDEEESDEDNESGSLVKKSAQTNKPAPPECKQQ